jgi:hypothetical protein
MQPGSLPGRYYRANHAQTGTRITKRRLVHKKAHSLIFRGFFERKIWLARPYPRHSMLV